MNTPPNREVAIFSAALELPASQRGAYLHEACADDVALRLRLEALLRDHEAASAFLETPPPGAQGSPIGAKVPGAPGRLSGSCAEKAGDRIGRYRLLQQIGEGGCGVVYMAEQEEPIRRRVALKVIKLGMDTKQVIARFEAERQALALMDHPNIAKVFDAGATDTGRPYFVMELVRGIKVTDYCDKNNLSTEDRLKLFIQVCQAIQHAHQKGIIHRDIKPSNILVTISEPGAPGFPKVIDFGIAKATGGQPLTDKTVFTAFEQFIGTPAYMSPEQAMMTGLDIDTRTDIYALGVLLYELLTGQTPFDAKELMAAGLDAMRRIIREQEPVRPSTRLSTLLAADFTTVARHRQCPAPKLFGLIRGDLDWIVMKALEKDRARRYQTANGLAMDIQRHLDCEPVLARPPSRLYEFQKTVRRHSFGFVAAAAVAVALVIGLSLSTWLFFKERQARRRVVAAEQTQSQLRQQAEAQALVARQRAYAADMNLAQQASSVDNLGRAQELLNRQKPQPGERDLRGWEWRHLWSLCQSDALLTLSQYSNSITRLAFSRDGRLLLARDAKGRTLFLDIARKTEIDRLPSWAGMYRAMAVSPDGTLLAAGSMVTNGGHVVNLWDVASRQRVGQLHHPKALWALAFSPDGSRLASFGTDATVRLWEVASQRVIRNFPASQWTSGEFKGVVKFSPDGKTLAVGETDGRIRLIELEGNTERVIQAHAEGITALAFIADGKVLASASGYIDTAIRLWDVASRGAVGQLTGHTAYIHDLAVAPDGHTLASASGDQTIRLWDLDRKEPLATLRGHELDVYALAFSPDGNTLASGCKDGSICLWDPHPKPRSASRVTLPARVRRVAFSPDSTTFHSLDTDGSVSVWDALRVHLMAVQSPLGTNNTSLAVSPDGRLLVVGDKAGALKVWDRSAGRELTRFSAHSAPIIQLKFGTNSQVLVSGSFGPRESTVKQWNTATWQERARYKHEEVIYFGFDVSPSGTLVAEGNGYGTLAVWNLLEARMVATWTPHVSAATALAFAPNGALLASGSFDSSLKLFEVGTWRQVAVMHGDMLGINALAFSPDGRRLATSGMKEAVKLWDVATSQEVLTLEGEGAPFDFTAFSPDGNTLVAVNRAGTAHLWRPPALQEIDAQIEARVKSPKVGGPEHPQALTAMGNLAISYTKAGRREEACKLLEEALLLRRKLNGPEHPDTLYAVGLLANAYDQAGRQDEALKLREQVLPLDRKVLGPEHPHTLDAMNGLAHSYFAFGRGKEAIALLAQACELNPKDTIASLTLATWQAWFGQDADYEATRRRLLQQAEGTDQAGTAERAAKAACMRPSTDAALLAQALTLARQGVELGKSLPWLPWYQLGLGLAEYRNGQYAAAERTLTIAEQTAGEEHDIPGTARLFRAMSLFRQDRSEEARKLLTQAEAQMPPLPADVSKPLVDGKPVSHDELICWLAYKEAKALIEGSSVPVAEPSAPK